MTVRRLSLLAILLAALVGAGCARADQAGGTSAGAPGPASSAGSPPAAPPAAQPAPSSAAPVPSAAGAITVSGTVTAGVEPNCLLLTGKDDSYLLVFDDESMRSRAEVGARITVTGRAEPAMLSTCQQGTPFIVTAVRAG